MLSDPPNSTTLTQPNHSNLKHHHVLPRLHQVSLCPLSKLKNKLLVPGLLFQRMRIFKESLTESKGIEFYTDVMSMDHHQNLGVNAYK